jgi:cytochrome d ubiquinol oxidase subunit II
MSLNILWFFIVGILLTGYFLLEGFDFGVGILLPFIGRDDQERRMIINSIGPHWDANEVWLISAGTALFAAFPEWYATLFSGFYLALLLILVTLIVRGAAFELRSKLEHRNWRRVWDWAIFLGSCMPSLLWGVALGNLIRGVPVGADMAYAGGFLNLLNPFSLLCGLVTLSLFTIHGALFLQMKLENQVSERAKASLKTLWPISMVLLVAAGVTGWLTLSAGSQLGPASVISALGAIITLVAVGLFVRRGREGWSFAMSSACIVLGALALFLALFPRLLVSSLDPAWSLTIYNASSSAYTLQVITIITLTLLPIIVLYQSWSYRIFRKRISHQSSLEY